MIQRKNKNSIILVSKTKNKPMEALYYKASMGFVNYSHSMVAGGLLVIS
jgi:hypothetical protein